MGVGAAAGGGGGVDGIGAGAFFVAASGVGAATGEAATTVRLYTAEGEQAGYTTKWEELRPVSQHLLLQIEEKIRDERHVCEQVEQ